MNRVIRILITLSTLSVNYTYCSNKSLQDANNTVMIELSTIDSEDNFNIRTTEYPIFGEKDNFGKNITLDRIFFCFF